MYARLSALFCLLSVSAAAGDLETLRGSNVELYLKSDGGSSPSVLNEMKSELASLMRSVGVRIGWWGPTNQLSGVEGNLVVIDLRGTCTTPEVNAATLPVPNFSALASSAVADGHVLPFSWVDCNAVNSFLADSMATMPGPQRAHVYGCALARLLAHEMYHVLTQNIDHEESGIAKAQFTPLDLITDRLEFVGSIHRPRPLDQSTPLWTSMPDLDGGK